MTRMTRWATGVLFAAMILLPPAGRLLESRMLVHMLVQMPLLLAAGALAAKPSRRARRSAGWNQAGVVGLLFAAMAMTFWMLPIAIDRAVASPAWDAAKGATLMLAGAAARVSWRAAPAIVQAFFAGNAAWMTIVAGQLYEELDVRLCNAYLLGDQVGTGIALSWTPILAAAAWGATSSRARLVRSRTAPKPS